MAETTESLSIDPDNIPETLCVGKFNISITGALATLTFTHSRPKSGPLLDAGKIEVEHVVRARIVTTLDNLAVLREALSQIIATQTAATAAPESSGTQQLN